MSAAQPFQSLFCRFEAPAGWVPLGNVGLIEDSKRSPRPSAAVSENFYDPPKPLAEIAVTTREHFLSEHPGAELLSDGSLRSDRFPDAHLLRWRLPAGGGALLLRQLLVAHGPLVCSLATASPEGDSAAEEGVGAIVASFEVTAAGWARDGKRETILVPPPEAAGRSGGATEVASIPELGLRFPVAPGWALDAAAGRISRDDARFSIRHHGRDAGNADRHFARGLARLQRDPGWTIRSWDRGELPATSDCWAISAEEKTVTWGTPNPRLLRLVFADLDGVVEIALEASSADTGAREAFEALLAGLAPLPPEERKVPLHRSWLPEFLEGPWVEEAPGLFLRSEPTLAVFLQELHDAKFPAFALRGIESFLQEPPFAGGRSDTVEGFFRERPAIRFSVDSPPENPEPQALRSAWIDAGRALLLLVVRGGDVAEVDRCWLRLLDAIRPERFEAGGAP
jgi:hypothetical protein